MAMRVRAMAAGAVLCVLGLAPLTAAAQDWSVMIDAIGGGRLQTRSDSGTNEYQSTDQNNFMLGLGTSYHVGFMVEDYRLTFVPGPIKPNQQVDLKIQSFDVFVDLPVPFSKWWGLALGVGQGTGKFNPNKTQDKNNNGNSSTRENMNLGQYFGVLGLKLFWGLELRVGLHEYFGKLVARNRDANPVRVDSQNISLRMQTLGLRYTF
jgi:hypothetical protein